MTNSERGSWQGRLGFILAAAGSAVGLGNLWKFPYLTYKHGGGGEGGGAGAFVFIYLAAVLLIGAPIMLAEILIGKRTGRNPVGAFKALKPGAWKLVGALGVTTGFILLSYYSVVAGWTVQYVIMTLTDELQRAVAAGATGKVFGDFVADPARQIGFHALFMGFTIAVILGGVSKGIERWTKVLMPLLLAILVVLLVRSLTLGKGVETLAFVFVPDFPSLTGGMVLEAVGQAFFSLSLGMGAIITYGSYMKQDAHIGTAGGSVVLLDTLVGLMASLIVFGAIFSAGMSMEGSGIGNLFTAVPVIFDALPGGSFLTILFYVLVMFAALTSTISLLETVSAYFIDERGLSRRKATTFAGGGIFLLGIPAALSFNLLSDKTIAGKTFFDLLDYFCSNISLPLGGLLVAVFVGWVLDREILLQEIDRPWLVAIWRFLLRFVAPVAIGAVMVTMILGTTEGG